MISGRILITGGAGTLGRAIIDKAHQENWDCQFTIYSTDVIKHKRVLSVYPDVKSVVGDIRDYDVLSAAVAGHDIVIHAAAVKHIPVSEENVADTISVNIDGSIRVAQVCIHHNISKCVGISTDKACSAHNAYGATKFMLEKMYTEFNLSKRGTKFHILRYGNVIESTGSVVEAWEKLYTAQKPLGITSPQMTRFWLSPQQAVDSILRALDHSPLNIYIPKFPALSIVKMAEYLHPGLETVNIGMRPGEKIHETLVTKYELPYTSEEKSHFSVGPSLGEFAPIEKRATQEYTSANAREMTKAELFGIIEQAREIHERYE